MISPSFPLTIIAVSTTAWQRIRAANKLSLTGPQWYDIVSKHNSGTYNNQVAPITIPFMWGLLLTHLSLVQYMIIDGKLFRPGNALQPDSLFIVEQIPGHVAGSDATDILAKGYWGSFNGEKRYSNRLPLLYSNMYAFCGWLLIKFPSTRISTWSPDMDLWTRRRGTSCTRSMTWRLEPRSFVASKAQCPT